MKTTFRLSMRNLVRNRVRTGLSVGGIAVAAIMLIFNLGFIGGFYDMMIRGSTEVEIGHVQVQHRDYVERPSTLDYLEWDSELSEALTGAREVRAVAPRVRLFGLVGHEERSQVGRIVGVDPSAERSVTVIADGVREGRWLSEEIEAGGVAEAVIGRGLARSLGVGVGDELVVIAEGADGSMGDALLEIVGIVQTGSPVWDRSGVLLHLEEAQYIAAMEGAVHEVVIALRDPGRSIPVARELQARVDAAGREHLAVRPWEEVNTGLYEMLNLGNQSNYIIFLVIAFIVALGVLNALRMSARERSREFGVMLAMGMARRKLFSMVMIEGAVLGVAGAVVGGIVGGLMTWYFAVYGLNMGAFLEGDTTYMGISFSEEIYFVLTAGSVLGTTIGLVMVTMLCALWPAVWSIRLNPRDAITGRQ